MDQCSNNHFAKQRNPVKVCTHLGTIICKPQADKHLRANSISEIRKNGAHYFDHC